MIPTQKLSATLQKDKKMIDTIFNGKSHPIADPKKIAHYNYMNLNLYILQQ